jgi:hypothetical protein
MNKCSCCKKNKDIEYYIKGEKTLKTCLECRDAAKQWKSENKERVQIYNKMSSDNKQNTKKYCQVVYARKKGDIEWIEFKSQTDAADNLGLYKSNINKVIKEQLKTTGEYEFKIKEQTIPKKEIQTWEQIKEENGFKDMVKGQPAKHRILHEKKDNIIGKCCCTCKEWKPLTNYNKAKKHWDNLRNECKDCLTEWRKNNRKEINKKYIIYEKNRKIIDPEFKLLKTLRSRLGCALSRKKSNKTLELTSCTISYLMDYLEAKFTEGMTWQNHGDWHIDHIKPCCSFNLSDKEEQKKCFHYTNLQPLWAKDNLSKGCKIIE